MPNSKKKKKKNPHTDLEEKIRLKDVLQIVTDYIAKSTTTNFSWVKEKK